ncbi:MAG TPA: RidA family protein [Chloroflexota bacterium]|jgi:enamine deaminase RidA (YjgF/YER057c/UK114 family)
MGAEARLQELGIQLPNPPEPVANYVSAKRVGNLLFVAGHGPAHDKDGNRPLGKVGRDLSLEEAYQAARSAGLSLLATLRAELGSLDHVRQLVKVLGMVNCSPGFNQTPAVMNGFSDLMVEVFGEAGRHARSAVGMAELPSDIPVEIEMIVEVE